MISNSVQDTIQIPNNLDENTSQSSQQIKLKLIKFEDGLNVSQEAMTDMSVDFSRNQNYNCNTSSNQKKLRSVTENKTPKKLQHSSTKSKLWGILNDIKERSREGFQKIQQEHSKKQQKDEQEEDNVLCDISNSMNNCEQISFNFSTISNSFCLKDSNLYPQQQQQFQQKYARENFQRELVNSDSVKKIEPVVIVENSDTQNQGDQQEQQEEENKNDKANYLSIEDIESRFPHLHQYMTPIDPFQHSEKINQNQDNNNNKFENSSEDQIIQVQGKKQQRNKSQSKNTPSISIKRQKSKDSVPKFTHKSQEKLKHNNSRMIRSSTQNVNDSSYLISHSQTTKNSSLLQSGKGRNSLYSAYNSSSSTSKNLNSSFQNTNSKSKSKSKGNIFFPSSNSKKNANISSSLLFSSQSYQKDELKIIKEIKMTVKTPSNKNITPCSQKMQQQQLSHMKTQQTKSYSNVWNNLYQDSKTKKQRIEEIERENKKKMEILDPQCTFQPSLISEIKYPQTTKTILTTPTMYSSSSKKNTQNTLISATDITIETADENSFYLTLGKPNASNNENSSIMQKQQKQYCGNIVERNLKWKEQKEKKIEKMKNEKENFNDLECTFQPKINTPDIHLQYQEEIFKNNIDQGTLKGVNQYIQRQEQARKTKEYQQFLKNTPYGHLNSCKTQGDLFSFRKSVLKTNQNVSNKNIQVVQQSKEVQQKQNKVNWQQAKNNLRDQLFSINI